MGIDTASYRVRHAPLPPALNVGPKSHDRWRVAFDISQRLMALSYEHAVAKALKFEPEFRAMVLVRLAALHGRDLDSRFVPRLLGDVSRRPV
jgi:hypothetical protein